MGLAKFKKEETARVSNLEWAHLKGALPLALVEFDNLGKYFDSNLAMAGLLGLSEEELSLLFQDRLDLITAEPRFSTLLSEVLGRTTRKTFKITLHFKDGASKLLMGVFCSRGENQGHIMSLVDVTRERDLTAQLRYQDSILRKLLFSNQDIVVETSLTTSAHQVLGAIPSEWEWSREQYENAFYSIRARVHEADAFNFDSSMIALSNHKISNVDIRCKLHIKESHYQTYRLSMSRSQEGDSPHILLVFKKCTEEKGAEVKDDLICRFINHEIKNMMTVVQIESARGLSLTHSEDVPTAKVQRTLKNIHRTSERLTALIDALERIKKGNDLLDIQPINLRGLLEEFIHFIGKYLKIHDVKVYLECRESLELKNNSILIQVILMNLVKNAMESLVASESRVIQIKASGDEANVVIHILDSGPGISQKMIHNLFDEGRSSKGVGRGLGLYLSRHIARKLGGDLKLLTASPACFEMTIPNL